MYNLHFLLHNLESTCYIDNSLQKKKKEKKATELKFVGCETEWSTCRVLTYVTILRNKFTSKPVMVTDLITRKLNKRYEETRRRYLTVTWSLNDSSSAGKSKHVLQDFHEMVMKWLYTTGPKGYKKKRNERIKSKGAHLLKQLACLGATVLLLSGRRLLNMFCKVWF